MKTMDKVLVIICVATLIFVIVMIWLFYEKGEIPDTLCTCFFSFVGSECGIMGWIKTTKEKERERQWEKEDKKESKGGIDNE